MAVAEKREPFPDSRPVKRRRLRSIEKEGIRAVRNFEIKLRAVKSLTLYAGNPRTHSTKQIRQIANSLLDTMMRLAKWRSTHRALAIPSLAAAPDGPETRPRGAAPRNG